MTVPGVDSRFRQGLNPFARRRRTKCTPIRVRRASHEETVQLFASAVLSRGRRRRGHHNGRRVGPGPRCRASGRPEPAADEHGAASLAEAAARRARAHREVVWPGRECRGPRVVPQPDGRRPGVVPTPGPVRRAYAAREVPARCGLPPAGVREPAQRVVLEVLYQRRHLGAAGWQEDRDQGQRVRGRDPDDERLRRSRRLRARCRRDARHPDSRRRRRDRRQGRLRAPLLLRGQPHLRHRTGAEPARPEALCRWFLERERGARRRPGVRYGHRRRPGRIDPDPQLLFGRRRPQADLRTRAVHGGLPDRADARSHRPYRAHRGRLRAAARSDRGSRRPRPSAVRRRPHGGLHEEAAWRRPRPSYRLRTRGLRLAELRAGRGQDGAGRRSAPDPRRRHRDRGLGAAPSRRDSHLERDRGRRRHDADGQRQQHGDQLEGTLHNLAAGLLRPEPPRAGERSFRDGQTGDPARPVHAGQLSRPILRQGPEPRSSAAGGL